MSNTIGYPDLVSTVTALLVINSAGGLSGGPDTADFECCDHECREHEQDAHDPLDMIPDDVNAVELSTSVFKFVEKLTNLPWRHVDGVHFLWHIRLIWCWLNPHLLRPLRTGSHSSRRRWHDSLREDWRA